MLSFLLFVFLTIRSNANTKALIRRLADPVSGTTLTLAKTKEALDIMEKVFGRTSTSGYIPNHPLNCQGQCGVDYLSVRYRKSRSVVRGSLLKKLLLQQSNDADYKQFIDETEPEIFGAEHTDLNFIYETPKSGSFNLLQIICEPIYNENDWIKRIKKMKNIPDYEPLFNIKILRAQSGFKLSKIRMVIQRSKKKFLSHKTWEEIVYKEPTLTSENIEAVVRMMHSVIKAFPDIQNDFNAALNDGLNNE